MAYLTPDQPTQDGGSDLRTKAMSQGAFPAGQALEQFFQVFGGQTTPQPPPGDHEQDNQHFRKGQAQPAQPSAPASPILAAEPAAPAAPAGPAAPAPEGEGDEDVAQQSDQGDQPDQGDDNDADDQGNA